MFDIVCIGSTTRDNFLKGNYTLIDWPETPLGKAFALPYGEKIGIEEVHFTIGGNAANASVTFARHGLKTAVAAKIGDDLPGEEVLAQLNREGVATDYIVRTKKRPTAYSALILKDGERTILNYHGASDLFSLGDLDLPKLKARWWYLSLSGESDKMYPALIEFAVKNKIKVAFNPSGRHIAHRGDEIRKSLRHVDFLVLNEGEAAELVKVSFRKEKEVLRKLDALLSPGIVAITNGEKGVMVSDGKTTSRAGIFREKEVRDRTGAGDAFGSGFVAVLADGGSMREAIRFASANATSVIEQVGGTEGALTKREFETEARWKSLEIQSGGF